MRHVWLGTLVTAKIQYPVLASLSVEFPTLFHWQQIIFLVSPSAANSLKYFFGSYLLNFLGHLPPRNLQKRYVILLFRTFIIDLETCRSFNLFLVVRSFVGAYIVNIYP